MASFVVMEPPESARDGRDAILVRDGFHFLAFLVPFLWLFIHRLWIEGFAALLLAIMIGWLSTTAMFGGSAAWLSVLVSIYVGIEGAALKLAALRRQAWREWGVVEANNRAEAELRYLAEAVGDTDSAPPPRPLGHAQRPNRAGSDPDAPALGMLGYSGGR